jgi:hypothetical protein
MNGTHAARSSIPCQVTGTEENYYSTAIDKSVADVNHAKQANKRK